MDENIFIFQNFLIAFHVTGQTKKIVPRVSKALLRNGTVYERDPRDKSSIMRVKGLTQRTTLSYVW